MAIIQNSKILETAREFAKRIVRTDFKNDYDQPFEMTDSQADLFLMVFLKLHPRCVALTYTQWGKTDIVAMALLERSAAFKEMWTVVAGKMGKGMLIMKRVIQHAFDSPKFYERLELDKSMPIERLKRERSKESITWLGGGGIRVLSANTSNKNQIKEAIIGETAPNVVLEEAPFIPDSSYAMVYRMTIGHKGGFILKLGNAFNRNHYYRSVQSNKWMKIIIDYHQGILEGRVTEEQIEEAKELPFFKELYECKFPDREDLTTDGYLPLISDELIEKAWITVEEAKEKGMFEGRKRLGGDFAGGGNDRSAYVLRTKKLMWIHSTNKLADTMQQVPIIEKIRKEYEMEDYDIHLDAGGLGKGVPDRLKEKGVEVNAVMFGGSAPEGETDRFINMRAYMYYRFLRWLKKGGRIVKDDRFLELQSVNYKSDSERKFKIQPKEELKKVMKELGIKATSPDVADAGALTFADNSQTTTVDDIAFV